MDKALILKLKQARIESGLTQVQVAEKIRKPQSFISKIEQGERRLDVTELSALAKVYKKPISFFLE